MFKLAIDRPITTLMFVVALVIFGFMGYKGMPSSLFPKVDFPVVTITTIYNGADPKTVESKVTDKIEEVLSSIDGVEKITSTSSSGRSVVAVQFLLERDLDNAANDVRDKVSSIYFSSDIDKPIISKLDTGGSSVINVFVSSDKVSNQELMLYVDKSVKPVLQRVSGVGEIAMLGYRDREIKIYPDTFMLNKYGISIVELNSIIANENIKMGSGKLISSTSEQLIKIEADAKNIEELENIKIKDGVRLVDVARVEDALEDRDSFASFNGVEGVMLEVKKISGKNSVAIAQDIKNLLPTMQEKAGELYQINYLGDKSEFIIRSLEETEFDLIYGSILATIIVFFFLRNFTATIVAAIAIPTSIFGTFFLMSYMGYDLNKLTLVGLALAIGIIIDDSIVVIENIYKKLESGLSTYEASLEGVKEISFSILGISAMLLAVFIPVSFMDGIVGKFFESFAMTITFAIIISYIIVTTFIPALSARVLKKGEGKFYHLTEPFFQKLDLTYSSFLDKAVRFKYITLMAILGIFFVSLQLASQIGMDFKPKEDNSEFLVNIEAPSGISLEQMVREAEAIANKVKENEYVEYVNVSVGYNSTKDIHKARIYAKLVDLSLRDKGQFEIINDYRGILKSDTLDIKVSENSPFKVGDIDAPFQVILKSDSLESLAKTADKLKAILATKEGIVDLDSNFRDGKPELRVLIDRKSTTKYGISTKDVVGILTTAFSSDSAISQFDDKGRQFDITLRLGDSLRDNLSDLKNIQVKAPNGELVYLDGLVKFEEATSPAAIYRVDRQRDILVYSQLEGLDLGSAVAFMSENIESVLSDDVTYELYGDAKEMAKTGQAFAFAVGLTIILMYIILAALYESLVQPIIIMITLPLSVMGVLIALYASGYSFNLFVMIGIMLLLGMVGKNGVLIVDFANQEIKKGKDVAEAIVYAGQKRLRPILMTTFAMIFAMIPIAFGSGAGAETKAPMAMAIIGGLISSTLLTLVAVPAFYRILYPLDSKLRKFYDVDSIKDRG